MAKKNLERRMIPFGIDLNTIPREETETKAVIPIEEPVPLAIIPPQPRCYGQSYFAEPIHTKPLLLEGAPSKGPIIALSAGTNILLPKRNEKLLVVKTNKKGRSSTPNTPLVNVPTLRGFALIHRRSNSSPKGSFEVHHDHSLSSVEAPQDDD